MTTVRMRVLSARLRTDKPIFAIVSLARVATRRSDLVELGASELGTLELEVWTSELAHFVPGSEVEMNLAPSK